MRGELGATLDAAHRGIDPALRPGVLERRLPQQLQVAGDHLQHVVEVVRHAAGELADRLHLLRLVQRRLHRQALFLAAPQGPGALVHQMLQLVAVALQLVLRALLLGDVVALQEDARDRPVGLDHRLQHRIDEALFQRLVVVQPEPDGAAGQQARLAGGIDLVHQLEHPLALQLGQGFVQRRSHQAAALDQRLVGGVGHLEHMARPPEKRHEARGLREEAAHQVGLHVQQAVLLLHGPRALQQPLLLRLLEVGLGEVVADPLLPAQRLQFGHVLGVLQHVEHPPVLAQQGRVGGTPVPVREHLALRRIGRDAVADQRKQVGLGRAHRALQRLAQQHAAVVHAAVGRARKGIEHRAVDDARQRTAGDPQVGGVGVQDDERGRHDHVRIGRRIERGGEVKVFQARLGSKKPEF